MNPHIYAFFNITRSGVPEERSVEQGTIYIIEDYQTNHIV